MKLFKRNRKKSGEFLTDGMKAQRGYVDKIYDMFELRAFPPFSFMPKDPNGDLVFPRLTKVGDRFDAALKSEMQRIHLKSKAAAEVEELDPEMFADAFSSVLLEFREELEIAKAYREKHCDSVVALEAYRDEQESQFD
jgi:hypothetical protein